MHDKIIDSEKQTYNAIIQYKYILYRHLTIVITWRR